MDTTKTRFNAIKKDYRKRGIKGKKFYRLLDKKLLKLRYRDAELKAYAICKFKKKYGYSIERMSFFYDCTTATIRKHLTNCN